MITTVTLNTSVDKLYLVEKLERARALIMFLRPRETQ